ARARAASRRRARLTSAAEQDLDVLAREPGNGLDRDAPPDLLRERVERRGLMLGEIRRDVGVDAEREARRVRVEGRFLPRAPERLVGERLDRADAAAPAAVGARAREQLLQALAR